MSFSMPEQSNTVSSIAHLVYFAVYMRNIKNLATFLTFHHKLSYQASMDDYLNKPFLQWETPEQLRAYTNL